MSIEYAILGLLSWRPFYGYDLKKIISESDVFYWSGNNNQIYRALVDLNKAGLVTQEVQQQENLPAKKTYSITPRGQEALREWVLAEPELPELRSTFLVQLAWADQLRDDELDQLLSRYQREVEGQLLMQKEKTRRQADQPGRTERETFLWQKIQENLVSTWQNELEWVSQVRKELQERGWK